MNDKTMRNDKNKTTIIFMAVAVELEEFQFTSILLKDKDDPKPAIIQVRKISCICTSLLSVNRQSLMIEAVSIHSVIAIV